MKHTGFNVAYCGIICALSLIVMFAAIIPSLAYVTPAFAGLLIWTVSGQINRGRALLTYAASALLALILVPEVEAKTLFVLIFGYYPILRDAIKHVKPAIIQIIIKFAIFNAAAVLTYTLVTRLFGVNDVLSGMEGFGEYAVYIFWAMGNVAFFFYDFSLKYVQFAYFRWLKPVLNKKIK